MGGDLDTVWNFIEREGLVSENCFGYYGDDSVGCNQKCTTEKPLKVKKSSSSLFIFKVSI
jgi:hypothetical protein